MPRVRMSCNQSQREVAHVYSQDGSTQQCSAHTFDWRASGCSKQKRMTADITSPALPVMQSRVRPRVVILGGGFGGVAAARALGNCQSDILLIDRRNHHIFQPL